MRAVRTSGRIFARRLTVAALATSLALVAAEAVLRLWPCPISPVRRVFRFCDDDRVYTLEPNANLLFEGVLSRLDPPVRWRINSQGHRDDRDFSTSPGTKQRIAVYGDSDAFGWAVDLEDTFQKQMETLQPSLEVMNFGVPGYNIDNIATHVEKTLPVYRPDVVVYLVHPNDFEPPLQFLNRFAVNSELARRVAYSVHRILLWERHKELRRTPGRVTAVVDGLQRIRKVCTLHGCDCFLLFIDGNDPFVVDRDEALRDYFLRADHPRVYDLSSVVAAFPLSDEHLSKPAHKMLATLLLDALDPVRNSTHTGR